MFTWLTVSVPSVPACRPDWVLAVALTVLAPAPAAVAALDLGPEEFVEADGAAIWVPGYSVPSFAHWNEDGVMDLIVGEGSGTYAPRVRVYLNVGTADAPAFAGFLYAQSDGADLTETGSGCLGLFPRVVYWDDDIRKDLLVGTSLGNIRIYLNVNTNGAPEFDAGTDLTFGPPGGKVAIDVGSRATPCVVDWNADGTRDLVVGAMDGRVRVFINEAADTAPDFRTVAIVPDGAGDLLVPGGRSSCDVRDLDGDGRKDLLAGNTSGQLLLYANTGTDAVPAFDGFAPVTAGEVPIDLPGSARSRPFVCDWTGDGALDVLVGAGDGFVRIYAGTPCLADVVQDGTVGFNDLLAILSAWGPCGDCPEDIDGDGVVGFDDLVTILSAWGGCP